MELSDFLFSGIIGFMLGALVMGYIHIKACDEGLIGTCRHCGKRQ
jgi:hypothetical protein